MGFSLKDPIQGSVTGNAGSADVAKKTQAALTIQKNGTTVGSTFDGSTARTINITVPTKVTDLSDNANYIKNTNYASATTAGVIKLGTGLAIADGVLSVTGAATADSVEWSVVKNKPTAVSYWTNDAGYIKASNTMKGATSTTAGSAGTVPAPAAGKEAQFLRGDGTWAQPSYATSAGSATKATQDGNGKVIASTYLPLSGGTLTTGAYNGLTIKRSDANGSSISYSNSAGNLGRIGFIASGALAITNGTGTDGTANMLGITKDGVVTVYNNLSPSTNNTRTLGTSSMKWSNVYATTFTGNLTGTATNATHITISDGSNDAERPMLVGNPDAGATAQNVFYESTITANYAQSRITAKGFKTGSATMTYNDTDKCVEFLFV